MVNPETPRPSPRAGLTSLAALGVGALALSLSACSLFGGLDSGASPGGDDVGVLDAEDAGDGSGGDAAGDGEGDAGGSDGSDEGGGEVGCDRPFYEDNDGDGHGDPEGEISCVVREGFVPVADDCDDDDPDVSPDEPEVCDGRDTDCNGFEDDVPQTGGGYVDQDGDGYGGQLASACAGGDVQTVQQGGDCDDADPTIYPGAAEICRDGVVNGCGAPPPECLRAGVVQLATADVILSGGHDDHAGLEVVGLGDMDSDGVAEIAVASRLSNHDDGRVWVVEGLPLSGVVDLDTAGWKYEGGHEDELGAVVAVGRFDQGAAPTLVITSPNYNSHEKGGAVYFRRDASFDDELRFGGDVLYGGDEDWGLGEALAVGDIDGDGVDEVLIGQPEANDDDALGRAFLRSGGPAGERAVFDGATILVGSASGGRFGASVAMGRLGASAAPMVVVGAPEESSGTGAARLFRGPFAVGTPAPYGIILGPGAGARFGASLSNVGDLDGDGVDEIAVGAPGANGGAGAVYVFSGADLAMGELPLSSALVTLSGESAGQGFGHDVAGAGDVDGDGHGDLLVGAGAGSGELAWLFAGPLQGAGGAATATVTFAGPGGDQPPAVAGLGDMNGDGFADVAVGASWVDGGHGAAYVFWGTGP